MYIRICGSTCANMVPGCSRPDDTRKHCPIARCPQRHPYANDTAHRPADSAAAPLPLPLAAATTTATTAATAAAAMLASVDVDAAASEDWSWARNVTCCEAADTHGHERVCALAGVARSSGHTCRPGAVEPRPSTLAHLVDGPGLAILVIIEHRLVVCVVAVVKVAMVLLKGASRTLCWHLNCDSTREDRCGESQASVDVDGCAGRIRTTGKRRARTASAACQGTRQSSARHGVSARCAAYRLTRLNPDRMPCCTRRRRRMRSLAVIKSTTSREELQEGDNNPSEQCAGEFLSRHPSGRP